MGKMVVDAAPGGTPLLIGRVYKLGVMAIGDDIAVFQAETHAMLGEFTVPGFGEWWNQRPNSLRVTPALMSGLLQLWVHDPSAPSEGVALVALDQHGSGWTAVSTLPSTAADEPGVDRELTGDERKNLLDFGRRWTDSGERP